MCVRSLMVSALALSAAAGLAAADVFTFNVNLSGAQEVPPVNTPATGTAVVTLNTETGVVTINGSYNGLVGTAPFGHLHGLAPTTGTAGVLFDLQVVQGAPNGTFSGTGVLTPAQVEGMLAGLTYINIHSSAFLTGEIRGQVIPTPGALALLGLGGFAAARRRR